MLHAAEEEGTTTTRVVRMAARHFFAAGAATGVPSSHGVCEVSANTSSLGLPTSPFSWKCFIMFIGAMMRVSISGKCLSCLWEALLSSPLSPLYLSDLCWFCCSSDTSKILLASFLILEIVALSKPYF